MLFPVLLECLHAGLLLQPAMPAVCSCLALLAQREAEESKAAAAAASAASAAPAAAGPLWVSPAVPQSQAAAICELLLHAASVHSDRGGLAAAALRALAKLIPSLLPSALQPQQQQQQQQPQQLLLQQAFLSRMSNREQLPPPLQQQGSFTRAQQQHQQQQQQQQQEQQQQQVQQQEGTSSLAGKAVVFVERLATAIEEHAGGAYPLSLQGWGEALLELLLLLHLGLLQQ